MRGVDESLKVAAIPEPFIDAEISDRQKSPIHGQRDIGYRHDLDAIDAEVGQVIEPVNGALDAIAKFLQFQFVEHEIGQRRRSPVAFVCTPDMFLKTERERRELADPKFARIGIDDPIEHTNIRIMNLGSASS